MFSECFRLEIRPFNIKVVNVRTGGVKSKLLDNIKAAENTTLPGNSIYAAARDTTERNFRGEDFEGE